eukprot:g26928.t1
MPALQLVCASSFYSDTEGAHINEAMHLPGGDPEDGLPEGPEEPWWGKNGQSDGGPDIKLLDEHMLRDKTVKGLGPFGLRVLGRRLFVCNSDQDEQLEARI